jgi:hypothetical protein
MDESTLSNLAQGLIAILLGIGAWMLRRIVKDLDDVEDKQTALELKVAEEYATKEDVVSVRQATNHSLDRIHKRIDDVGEKLDEKCSDISRDIKTLLQR